MFRFSSKRFKGEKKSQKLYKNAISERKRGYRYYLFIFDTNTVIEICSIHRIICEFYIILKIEQFQKIIFNFILFTAVVDFRVFDSIKEVINSFLRLSIPRETYALLFNYYIHSNIKTVKSLSSKQFT